MVTHDSYTSFLFHLERIVQTLFEFNSSVWIINTKTFFPSCKKILSLVYQVKETKLPASIQGMAISNALLAPLLIFLVLTPLTASDSDMTVII